MWLRLLALAALGLALGGTAVGANEVGFAEFLDGVRRDALTAGIRQATVDTALAGVQPIARVIELDRKQPERTLTFDEYIQRVVTPQRIETGRRKLAENRALLDDIARRYGVQPRYIVALWGIETDFGRLTGSYPVIAALATLAYDGRRSAFFRGELLNALRILDQGHVAPGAMLGSWAGAMGQNQFMPSSFLAYAVDQDGDGRRDIWTTTADVFASIANYLSRVGWKPDQIWGRPVLAPSGLEPTLVGFDARRPLTAWQTLGIRRADGGPLPDRELQAALIRPGGPDGPSYLVYDNYRTILKWNNSQYFATAVGMLAESLDGN